MAKHGRGNRRTKRVKGIGKNRLHSASKRSGKKTCSLCGSVLHGMPHGKRKAEISKLAKSEKRPTGLFGGVLCSRCRSNALEEAIRIQIGSKQMEEISLTERNFVEQALQHLNRQQKG